MCGFEIIKRYPEVLCLVMLAIYITFLSLIFFNVFAHLHCMYKFSESPSVWR